MSRAVRVLLVVVLVVILLGGGGAALVWWKLSGLKQQLVSELSQKLGAQVQVASLGLDLWKGELHAAGITLVNERPSSPWEKGDIAQATVRYHFADLFAPTLPVTIEVGSWNVRLHSPLRTAETPQETSSSPNAPASSAETPSRLRVTQLSGHDGTVDLDFSDDRKVTCRGVSFDATDNGANVWTTQLSATAIKAQQLELGASSVRILADASKLTFTELRMQCAPGAITGEGEVATDGNHDAQLRLKAVDLPMTMLVSLGWQQQVSGLVSADVTYSGNDTGGTAKGNLAVTHGKFNALPWLGKATLLVGLPDITGVEADKATADFTWTNGSLHLTNLDVRKNEIARIAGDVDIDSKGMVDGRLKLGLPSAATAKWPQLQEKVFSISFEDYQWAEVNLTGTPDHLQEDLTPRLLAAGLQQGGDLLKQATQKAGDLLNGLMGK